MILSNSLKLKIYTTKIRKLQSFFGREIFSRKNIPCRISMKTNMSYNIVNCDIKTKPMIFEMYWSTLNCTLALFSIFKITSYYINVINNYFLTISIKMRMITEGKYLPRNPNIILIPYIHMKKYIFYIFLHKNTIHFTLIKNINTKFYITFILVPLYLYLLCIFSVMNKNEEQYRKVRKTSPSFSILFELKKINF